MLLCNSLHKTALIIVSLNAVSGISHNSILGSDPFISYRMSSFPFSHCIACLY